MLAITKENNVIRVRDRHGNVIGNFVNLDTEPNKAAFVRTVDRILRNQNVETENVGTGSANGAPTDAKFDKGIEDLLKGETFNEAAKVINSIWAFAQKMKKTTTE